MLVRIILVEYYRQCYGNVWKTKKITNFRINNELIFECNVSMSTFLSQIAIVDQSLTCPHERGNFYET